MITIHNTDLIITPPKAVLFDTDNTLYEYFPAKVAAENAVCNKAINLLGIDNL